MSQKTNKKRRSQSTAAVNAKRRVEQARIADEKEQAKRRMDPVARAILLGDLILLAACQLLYNSGMISEPLANAIVVLGLVLLCISLWIQFGGKNQSSGRGLR